MGQGLDDRRGKATRETTRRGAGPDARPMSPSRRAIVAFILSGVFPGLGQLYNREWIKGAAFVLAGLALSWFLGRALPSDLEALAAARLDPSALGALGLLLAIWLWSVVDAWRRA